MLSSKQTQRVCVHKADSNLSAAPVPTFAAEIIEIPHSFIITLKQKVCQKHTMFGFAHVF